MLEHRLQGGYTTNRLGQNLATQLTVSTQFLISSTRILLTNMSCWHTKLKTNDKYFGIGNLEVEKSMIFDGNFCHVGNLCKV
jgi:hypothetical protein